MRTSVRRAIGFEPWDLRVPSIPQGLATIPVLPFCRAVLLAGPASDHGKREGLLRELQRWSLRPILDPVWLGHTTTERTAVTSDIVDAGHDANTVVVASVLLTNQSVKHQLRTAWFSPTVHSRTAAITSRQ